MAPYDLPKDAVWFITGCSSGLGLTLSTFLATHTQSRIVCTARQPTSLIPIPSTPNVLKLALDVTSESSIQSALSATLAKWSRIDVLVNNAGYGFVTDSETAPTHTTHALMDTNFWAPVRLTQLVLPILRDSNPTTGQRGGVVLQVTSMGGRVAFAGNAFYHASKFALEGFTEAIAKEMAPEWNVHFCCIEPGGVKTRYAETSTAGALEEGERHPAYLDPNLATNVLLKYKSSPDAMKNWAEPEVVVRAVYGVVRDGVGEEGEIPLRMPLGSDSWGMQKMERERELRDLEVVREVALSTSGEEQLASIGFLRK
ncbi:NAD(P)-binding protein [Polyplosphaeria fusca]|uniref:NAD(P)-binding protein n=1 Tax=Polyplosphaeria fusca TaxID=682080 RepID=A0A9P4VAC8_9PLEO|nr:NAD(P)-binding protein [Polyplosphaeria fusca]